MEIIKTIESAQYSDNNKFLNTNLKLFNLNNKIKSISIFINNSTLYIEALLALWLGRRIISKVHYNLINLHIWIELQSKNVEIYLPR